MWLRIWLHAAATARTRASNPALVIQLAARRESHVVCGVCPVTVQDVYCELPGAVRRELMKARYKDIMHRIPFLRGLEDLLLVKVTDCCPCPAAALTHPMGQCGS